MVLAVTGAVVSWVDRTAAPWPAVAGDAYPISYQADGCPTVESRPFVDAPGPLVPPDPTSVTLCATPAGDLPPGIAEFEPRQRTLRTGAAEFAALLNGLPDRNEAWRRWQHEHSGWWPDAPPAPMGETCIMIGYTFDHSFVLRYADGSMVAVVSSCARSTLTTGSRTRMDYDKPHVYDEFLRRFAAQ